MFEELAFPDRLRVLRARKGLSVRQAAEQIPMDRHVLSALEHGTKTPTFPLLKKLSDFYEIEVDDLATPEILGLEAAGSGKAVAPPEAQTPRERRLIEEIEDFVLQWQPAFFTLDKKGYEEYRRHAHALMPLVAWAWEGQIKSKREELGREPRPDELSLYEAVDTLQEALRAGRVRARELETEAPAAELVSLPGLRR